MFLMQVGQCNKGKPGYTIKIHFIFSQSKGALHFNPNKHSPKQVSMIMG